MKPSLWPKKKSSQPYTPHSAPVTNGILRNGRGASSRAQPRNSNDRHVTFVGGGASSDEIDLRRRTGSGMNPESNDSAAASEFAEERRRSSYRDYDERMPRTRGTSGGAKAKATRPGFEKKGSDRAADDADDASEGGGARRRRRPSALVDEKNADQSRDERPSSSPSKSDGAKATRPGFEKKESDGTMDTAELSDSSAELPPRRRRLSALIDEKIADRGRIERPPRSRSDSSGAKTTRPQPRRRLSDLIDEKIAAKSKRSAGRSTI